MNLIGRRVRIGRYVRTIVRRYSDISGGVRLDRAAHGFVSWNVADLKCPGCGVAVDYLHESDCPILREQYRDKFFDRPPSGD